MQSNNGNISHEKFLASQASFSNINATVIKMMTYRGGGGCI